MEAFPDDADSDGSDEWDAQESEEEWEDCVGDAMYSDYRRMQRGTFLVAHIRRREEAVRHEMGRWMRLMERLGACRGRPSNGEAEEFGLDCHDLSLENVFVDEKDHTKIVSRTLGSDLTYRLTLAIDLRYRLGIDDDTTALGMCTLTCIRAIESIHRSTLPRDSRCYRNWTFSLRLSSSVFALTDTWTYTFPRDRRLRVALLRIMGCPPPSCTPLCRMGRMGRGSGEQHTRP